MDPYIQVRIVEQFQSEIRAEAEERRRSAQFNSPGQLSSWVSALFALALKAQTLTSHGGRGHAVGSPATKVPRTPVQKNLVSHCEADVKLRSSSRV
ncbi:MAG TPA: hypothetical protein DEV93_00380 [Chloroflexi bacterium]|nr:hypothetical protein [Chloroflexota bacterium]